jgi:hypothetical protein
MARTHFRQLSKCEYRLGLDDMKGLMPALLDVKCHAGYGAKDLYFHFEIQNKIFKNKNHSVS